MGYSINLNRLAVKAYKEHLLNIELLPSRKVLIESIEQRFAAIQDCGISDIGALVQSLSTPKKMSAFSALTSIGEDYLKILKREISGPNSMD